MELHHIQINETVSRELKLKPWGCGKNGRRRTKKQMGDEEEEEEEERRRARKGFK